jgi:hypothetical protein
LENLRADKNVRAPLWGTIRLHRSPALPQRALALSDPVLHLSIIPTIHCSNLDPLTYA